MPGGTIDDDRDLAWSMVVLGVATTGKPPPVAVRVTDTTEIGPATPRLETSRSGAFDVRKGSNGTALTTVSLDASTVPQGNGPIDGVLQVRYEVRTTGPSGAGKLNLGVGRYNENASVPMASGQVEVGATTTLVSELVALTCQGRSRCTTRFTGLRDCAGCRLGRSRRVDTDRDVVPEGRLGRARRRPGRDRLVAGVARAVTRR